MTARPYPAIEPALPKGVADFLPEQADKISYIEAKVCRVFELWGFRRIFTPLLEYLDVMAAGLGDDLREKAFRFDDRQTGKLLAIPADITPQVARIEAMRLQGYPMPHRLYYNGRVLRHAEQQSGRSREIYQAGVELIGLDSPEADAEMIAMAVEVLQGLGFSEFKIDLGQVDFFRGILDVAQLPSTAAILLRDAIAKKDVSAVRNIVQSVHLSEHVENEILALPRLFGGCEVLEEAARVVTNERSLKALDNLRQVVDILKIHGIADYLTIDLGEIRGLNYHTGLTFEGFIPGLGTAVCSGGRYDELMGRYGSATPATGFAFNVLTLLQGVERQPEVEAGSTRDFLLFNLKQDRRDALGIARKLRHRGYTVARDIIQRDYAESLAYAHRMGIRHMIVVGENDCAEDAVVVVRVADGVRVIVSLNQLLDADSESQLTF